MSSLLPCIRLPAAAVYVYPLQLSFLCTSAIHADVLVRVNNTVLTSLFFKQYKALYILVRIIAFTSSVHQMPTKLTALVLVRSSRL